MTTSRKLVLGLLCGLIAGAFWGAVFLAPKLLWAFTPLQMTAGRYIAYGLASAVLLAPSWRTVMGKMNAKDWRDLAALSLLGNLTALSRLKPLPQKALQHKNPPMPAPWSAQCKAAMPFAVNKHSPSAV